MPEPYTYIRLTLQLYVQTESVLSKNSYVDRSPDVLCECVRGAWAMAWSVRSSVPARPDSCDAWSPARPKLNLFLEFAGATENVVSATADTRQDTRQHTQFASERTGASGRECERGAESQHATELRRLKDATTVHTGTQHTTRAISSQSEPPSSIDHFVCTGFGVCTAALRTQETSKRNPSGE